MLQFFRKNGHQENGKVSGFPAASRKQEGGQGPLVSFDDEGLYDIGEIESSKDRSRLSKTLTEILTDKAALNYFTQFLESRHGAAYIRCWLDIQNFKEIIKEKPEEVDEKTRHRDDQSSGHVDHDSLSVSTDCDSYTADSNSVCDEDRTRDVCDKESMSDSSCRFQCRSKECMVDYALRIFKKYIALEAAESVKCSEEVRRAVIENICDLCASCFDGVERFVYEVMEREYFQVFLGSDYFCKHQIDVLTSGNVVLEDVLYNETALFYFMEFLEQEGHRALLEFWLAGTNFQQQLQEQKDCYDPVEAQNDAVVLYDKYFSLQAHCPLGFGDKVRLAVEQNICGENGVILDCFHLPLKIVEKVLERNYLKPFLASQLFYKYLSELISTVQTYGFSNSFEQDKHSPSECSSERSFSTNSTFLAMENPTKHQKKKEKTANMCIDTRQLYDPDALWKRKKNNRLSFGRITELGRFETDFEPEPDKNHRSKLKNVMKRLVNLEDEEKRKEEMAWQVAEMIVKDITNVTLNQKPFDA